MFDCCKTPEEIEAQKINKSIDKELRKYKRLSRKEFKLLLLGTGESGKSTFIKQMRIIHGKGYSVADRREFTKLVYQNVFMGVQNLAHGRERLGINFASPDNASLAAEICSVDYMTVTSLDARLASAATELWRDKGMQAAYERRNEFYISDSAGFFMSNVARFVDSDYLPTQEDILRVRMPTTGIHEYSFLIKEEINFRLVDVGGQRAERRKWIHCFENVTSIIFLVALSEYDQRLMESACENRLEESLALYRIIIGYEWFNEASVILFLNKTDLLEGKIMHSHLGDHFPDFRGPKGDADAAKLFVQKMFVGASGKKNIYPFSTCATDTEQIRKVFYAVKDTVLQNHLQDFSIV